MGAVGGLVGGGILGGLLGGYGNQQAQKQQNQYLQQAAAQWNPGNMQSWMQQMNPQFMQGYQGYGAPGTQAGAIADISNNPGYIDPKLMNMPLLLSAQRAQSDLTAAAGKIGKSGTSGGIGNAYALANQAGQTMRDMQTHQQYGLWREQQKRADLNWLQSMYQGMMGQAGQAAGGQAQMLGQQQAPQNWYQIGGNAIQSGLGAYGMMGGQQQQQAPPLSQIQPPNLGPVPQPPGQIPGGFTPYQPPMLLGQPPSQQSGWNPPSTI